MTSQRTLTSRILIDFTLSIAVLSVLLALAASAQQAHTAQPSAKPSTVPASADQARILDSYGKLPLSFEANHGQTDARVKFLSRTSGYSLFLTADEAVVALRGSETDTNNAKIADKAHTLQAGVPAPKAGAVLGMKLRNANPTAEVTGVDELAGTSNYFIGNDPAKWRTSVPRYAKVKYEGIYSGIDLVYYGNQRQLEYDFVVAPGADPHRIAFDFSGAKRIRRDKHGDLVLEIRGGEIRWQKAVVYQEKDGARQPIAARYVVTATNRVGFELAKYDASRPLYIDPLLIYATYLGSTVNECVCNTPGANPVAIAVDSEGDAYVTGQTGSADFPVTPGAFQTYASHGGHAFVTKINPAGTALVYSSYLGGDTFDAGHAIAVDSSGNAYVTGRTDSTDFPVTPGAFQTIIGNNEGGNAFVTEINPSGSALVYSTFLGGNGSDQGFGIAVDSAGTAYVTGIAESTNFPVTPGAFQTTCGNPLFCGNAFVTKFNPTGSALDYSTYLGGNFVASGLGIALNRAGNAYVSGFTYAADFPTTPGSYQTACGGTCGYTAFVTQFNPSGSALVYSTYFSGAQWGSGIAVDSAGNAYITGPALVNLPVTPGAFQTTCGNPSACAFVTKFNPTGSALVYSTYLGGNGADGGTSGGTSIAVDSAGDAYVTGYTNSTKFPTESPLQGPGGAFDAFVAKLNPAGSALDYSTYLGGRQNDYGFGIAVDSADNAYLIGWTSSTNFPVTAGVFQPTYGAGSDAFVAEISTSVATSRSATSTALSSNLNPSVYGQAVTFTATVSSSGRIPPNGETVTFYTFSNGLYVLGTAPMTAGIASLTTSLLHSGIFTISAAYLGDANFTGSTSPVLQQVVDTSSQSATTTALTSSLNPSVYGQKVTWTATVKTSGSNTPTGKVNFNWSSYSIGTATLNSSGVATLTRSLLSADAYPLFAVYTGDTNNGRSASPILNQVITQTTSAATITASPNPSTQGQSVTFTAKITSPTVTPAGPVTFTAGKTVLGSVDLSDGKATFTTSALAVGSTAVTVTYPSDSDISSSSASVTQVVEQ